MKLLGILRKIAIAGPLVFVFFLGWYVGLPEKKAEASSEELTVWTCSMHPQIRQPESGLCPICAMDLIPLKHGGESGLREVKVSSEAAALMDLRVSPVSRRPASVDLRLFGKIAYDERHVNTITARIGGRLDRVFVDYTGTAVSKGDEIAEIYSPELFVAQQDVIKATRALAAARRGGTAAAAQTQGRILNSARERLRLLQLTDEQIDAIAAQSEPTDHITLYAPRDGIVTKRHVVEGAYVKAGDPLLAVAGLDSVWLNLEAYESDLTWLHFAQEVSFYIDALPGKEFHGRIAYIDPELDPVRRVVRVRVNVKNAERLLKPGMFVRARVDAEVAGDGSVIDPGLAGKWISPMHPEIIRDEPGECPICGMDLVPAEKLGFIAKPGGEHENALLVPASAVLRTGRRAVVYVRLKGAPEPIFEGREIMLGPRVADSFVVDSGLTDGELVVTRGAFKLDSELQLKARPSMMNRDAGLVETPASEAEKSLLGQWEPVPRALGRLENAVSKENRDATLKAFADLQAIIAHVKTDAFNDKTLADWNEFSRRLQNSLRSVELSDQDQMEMSHRDLRLAFENAGRYLGVPTAPAMVAAKVPEEKLAALRAALDAYFPLAKALAADDESAALAAGGALTGHLGPLGIAGDDLNNAKDIGALRLAFKPVSEELIAQIGEYGADRVGNAYVVHCPMAFDYEGGDWLSPRAEVLNPYFGDDMLNCGTISGHVSFEDSRETAPAAVDHSSHDHEHDHQDQPSSTTNP